jgi:DNA-directed RNA polymerase subunit RPC12/RpoP
VSATGRGVERVDQDFYPTPAWCVDRLLEACPIRPGLLYEPFAGDGSIIAAVNDVLPAAAGSWFASELREEAWQPLVERVGYDRVQIGDSINGTPFWDIDPFDSIITNPPFSMAFDALLMSMGRACFVAFLLRLNFLGSEERSSFWRQFPPDIYVLPDRPCFHVFIKDAYVCKPCKKNASVEEGEPAPRCSKCGAVCVFKGKTRTTSDSTEYAWFVYPDGVRERRKGEHMVLAPTPLEVRKAAIDKLLARPALAA